MRKAIVLMFALLVVFPSLALGGTQRGTASAAATSWQPFWNKFRAAIQKKDRVALKSMMPEDFSDGGGGETADEWLQIMNRENLWGQYRKSTASGTKPFRSLPGEGPTRVTRNNYLIFTYKNGRWWWSALMGD